MCDITEYAEDGRLVEPNILNNKGFRLQKSIKEVERLERPLTEEESKMFKRVLVGILDEDV